MASLRLQPPSPFNFKEPETWPKWKRRFEQFRTASGLAKDEEEKQVSTLLYCLGEEAEDRLNSTDITTNDRKKYDAVLKKFDEFFAVRRNVIFERARFNQRSQLQGESVEHFITTLYTLAEGCNYGDLKDEMIRDRIVVGIRDKALSERMQLDPKLTVDTAKQLARQREAVHEQQAFLRTPPKQELAVEAVGSNSAARTTSKPNSTSEATKCKRCGRGPHPRQSCPAKDAVCHKCRKKGHYSAHCLSRVPKTSQTASVYDTSYLTAVTTQDTDTAWNATISLNGEDIRFKLDTGAEVTVISEDALNTLTTNELQSSTKRLCGPDNRPLKVVGQLSAMLQFKDCTCQQTAYVVRDLQQNLLGLPAIQALHILTVVDAVEAPPLAADELFTGLGMFPRSFKIQLNPDAKPFALFTPRAVPIPLRKQVKEELDRMESLGVISPATEPTPWCSGMVVVPKKSGSVRICVDFRKLNESVRRETHPLPKVDDSLAQLAGATVFSKIDANSGFWQIPLDDSCKELTTFITPFGRYHFNRMPFGIASAPEHFQHQMEEILTGKEGVLCHMDDVLVFGRTQAEHDCRLKDVLSIIKAAGVTLNREKCEFNTHSLTFLGHQIDNHGVSPDPQKTSAIQTFKKPTNRTELRRFLGMANQLGKFTPNLAAISQPLRELLSTKKTWLWSPPQDDAFEKLKKELIQPTVLVLYDPNAELKISADASAYGLGAVLLQKTDQSPEWKPVAFASRALSDTEQRYSQIEKEALASVWACEKFSDYVLGKRVLLETDHKPLVPLFTTTHLDRMPPRVLRFRLRLTRFDYEVKHVPGKALFTADALSRAPETKVPVEEYADTEYLIRALVAYLPTDADHLERYRQAQQADALCSKVIDFCKTSWPDKHAVSCELQPYWKERGQFSLCDDLLLHGGRIVIAQALQEETLKKIHQGHQGMQKCRQRVMSSVWWPGVMKRMEQFVTSCPHCLKNRQPSREPLMQSQLPDYPWERVATDLFELEGTHYLVTVDYYSRYIEVQKLQSTTAPSVVTALKAVFTRYGIPAVVMSDNGPQFMSKEMEEFADSYNFKHLTSSPYYPQSNGLAERAVKTAKALLQGSPDPYIALLSYRATPLPWCGLSPGELLMGRRLRTDVPQAKSLLIPDWPYLPSFKDHDRKQKEVQKKNYDQRHRVRDLPLLPDRTPVWVDHRDTRMPGEIVRQDQAPRSYVVETQSGTVRRNRRHLRERAPIEAEQNGEPAASRSRIVTRSQTATPIYPPERFA